jgi:radical SAM protein with 4Fe4S-binding SPASM domain
MTITSSPTFCSAPWTSLNIDQTGRVSPCFHARGSVGNIKETTIQEVIHGPLLTDMRAHMARGEWHKGCSWCKQLEETTGASGRTSRYANKQTLEAIENDPVNYFELQHIVINWSNLCNLTCTYCSPQTSTAWQSIKGIPINHVKNDPELSKLIKTYEKTCGDLKDKLNNLYSQTEYIRSDINTLRLENSKINVKLEQLTKKKEAQTAEMDLISEEANKYLKEKPSDILHSSRTFYVLLVFEI